MSEVGDNLFVFPLVPRPEERLIMQQGNVASLLVVDSHAFSHSENTHTHSHRHTRIHTDTWTFMKASVLSVGVEQICRCR